MPRKSHVALPSLVRLSAQRCKKIDNADHGTNICSTGLRRGSLFMERAGERTPRDGVCLKRVSLCQQADDLRKVQNSSPNVLHLAQRTSFLEILGRAIVCGNFSTVDSPIF